MTPLSPVKKVRKLSFMHRLTVKSNVITVATKKLWGSKPIKKNLKLAQLRGICSGSANTLGPGPWR